MRFLQAVALLVLMLKIGIGAPLQFPQEQQQRGSHQVQVYISLPSGAGAQTLTLQIASDRGFRKSQIITGETFIEFTEIPNGDYTITVTPDMDGQLEPYTERFSILARYSQVRRINVLLRL